MKREDFIYYQIEDYIHGRLTTEQSQVFEAELSNNPDLAKRVKLHQLADDLVIENRLLEVKTLLNKQTHPSSFGKITYTAIALLVAASIVTGSWLLNRNKAENPEPFEQQSGRKIFNSTKKEESKTRDAEKALPQTNNKSKTSSNIHNPLTLKDTEASTTNTQDNLPNLPIQQEATEDVTTIVPAPTSEEVATTEIPVIEPCAQTVITASIKTQETCEGEAQGIISVQQIKGGKEPYTYTIYHGEDIKEANVLSAGFYKLVISDGNGCQKVYEQVTVKSKSCPKDYSFNPFFSESWEIPSQGKAGKLLIYDASGSIYYEKQITEGATEHWSGEGKNGEIKPGYYIFVIDRGKGNLVQGSVTIVQ